MKYIFFPAWLFTAAAAYGQAGKAVFPLSDTAGLNAMHVVAERAAFKGKKSLKVADQASVDQPELKMVLLAGSDFHNGSIEVELAGEVLGAGAGARGFVGIAFRVNPAVSAFECIYLRPTNARADDQVRRNHSVQYISYPGFPWQRLRKEFPGKYESYADMEPAVWTRLKIVVEGNTARLYLHGAAQPALVITDLKHGKDARGAIGLWIGPGTEAHFRKLVLRRSD